MSGKQTRRALKNKSTITLADIARKCGLSTMTVSRALNKSDLVSDDTRRRVEDVARRLGYVPNRLAVSFGRQKTRLVGFIVPELDNNYFAAAMMNIEQLLRPEGYQLCLCYSYAQPHKELAEAQALLERRVDGIILAPANTAQSARTVSLIRAADCPCVLFDRLVPRMAVDSVTVDDFEGAVSAVNHLIEQGYKNVAHITGPENQWTARERLRGYRKALNDAGYRVRTANIIHCDAKFASARAAAARLLTHPAPPDAIFCGNDAMALGAFVALREHGVLVPETMGLVGFGHLFEDAVLCLQLTTVAQDVPELAAQCAKILLMRMNSAGPEKPVHYVSKTRLLVQNSSQRSERPGLSIAAVGLQG